MRSRVAVVAGRGVLVLQYETCRSRALLLGLACGCGGEPRVNAVPDHRKMNLIKNCFKIRILCKIGCLNENED